ncbi:hypothetical protein [Phenylobacterium sp.]|uniref:hypothetical protein n=1 Tax=Phenylobacterium sp. TaxID=1871053 RepID=UPI00286D6897|nr:hypothetical protein [Phenylobacterium sp.]
MAGRFFCMAFGAFMLSGAAMAQEVAVTPLAAPDYFSTAGRDTGLGPDLWRGTAPATARAVILMLATKPLSPAGRGLAARVLATGATGPEGVGRDPALAGARVSALLALGAVSEASAILDRSSGLDRSPELARAAAEAALLADAPDRACAVAAQLATGRDDIYWLRLRAYCQARAGETGAAQLTYDLAQTQVRDPVFGRLMGVKLAGGGDPGPASLRNGLDYALSRDLSLDLAQAKASPAVAAALDRGQATPTLDDATLADAVSLARAGQPDAATLNRLIARATAAEAKVPGKAQNAALIFAALSAPADAAARGELATYSGAETKASPSRMLAMELAADGRLVGETALLALWIAGDSGVAGPPTGDRVRVIRALKTVGLQEDARAYAAEGLAAQR